MLPDMSQDQAAHLRGPADGVPSGLVLGVWEAVSSERSLPHVLEATTDVSLPVVPFGSIGVFAPAGRAWFYVVGHRHRDGETPDEYMRRREFSKRVAVPTKPRVPYPKAELEPVVSPEPYVVPDLFERDAWTSTKR